MSQHNHKTSSLKPFGKAVRVGERVDSREFQIGVDPLTNQVALIMPVQPRPVVFSVCPAHARDVAVSLLTNILLLAPDLDVSAVAAEAAAEAEQHREGFLLMQAQVTGLLGKAGHA